MIRFSPRDVVSLVVYGGLASVLNNPKKALAGIVGAGAGATLGFVIAGPVGAGIGAVGGATVGAKLVPSSGPRGFF
jgi:hypothetical protein